MDALVCHLSGLIHLLSQLLGVSTVDSSQLSPLQQLTAAKQNHFVQSYIPSLGASHLQG